MHTPDGLQAEVAPEGPRAVSSAPSAVAGVVRSVSTRLLRSVMSVYLLVTLVIFGLELTLQYRQARSGIDAELAMLQGTFRDSVSHSLWNMDAGALDATLSGLLQMPSVSRVIARGPDGAVISDSALGAAARPPPTGAVISNRQSVSHTRAGKTTELGTLEIQSASGVIVERLRAGFLFSMAAAIAKTAVLVFLVRRFFFRILSRPLYRIAEQAAAIDPKAISAQPLPVTTGPRDELAVISDAINRLAAEVAVTVGALDTLNKGLEAEVAQRTALLQKACDELDRERCDLSAEVVLREANEAELKRINLTLSQSLEQLRVAQESLVESEKMAALGGLVAGIAHEINTPIGIGLTGSSHFHFMLEQLEAKFRAGELEEPAFERFIAEAKELSRSMCVSLEKAAALIRSFKLIAVDQTLDEARDFNVSEYLGDVLLAHHAVLRQAQVAIRLECDRALVVHSFPGAWSQILSNLIANSLRHGFEPGWVEPRIHIAAREVGGELVLRYCDNGKGMTEAVAKKVFDPFFTTDREGGSGLGMHVVYNLVSQRLHGRIALQTAPRQGVTFTLSLPQRQVSATTAA